MNSEKSRSSCESVNKIFCQIYGNICQWVRPSRESHAMLNHLNCCCMRFLVFGVKWRNTNILNGLFVGSPHDVG